VKITVWLISGMVSSCPSMAAPAMAEDTPGIMELGLTQNITLPTTSGGHYFSKYHIWWVFSHFA